MNYLGIDWGSKRVGLAMGNSEAKLARPLPGLANNNEFVTQLADICTQESVDRLVVGLPRNLSGEETQASRQIRQFGQKLESELKLPVDFQDETLSTKEVAEHTPARKLKQIDIDSQAAGLILQDYLDKLA